MYTFQDFLNGKFCIWVDKWNEGEIRIFADLLLPFVTTWAMSDEFNSPLEYLLDKKTGPYHFIRTSKNILTGASGINGFLMPDKYITLSEFIDGTEKLENVEESEYMQVLLG